MEVIFRPKEGNKDRWEILIDGEKWREVHRAVFGRKPAFHIPPTEENLQSVFDVYEYRRVKGYVVWRLSSQSYHSEQLTKLLRERLVQEHTISLVIEEYQEMGLLNDEMWLQSFVFAQQKRYGLRLILTKLKAKGLSPESLQRVVRYGQNPRAEIQNIEHLLKTRYRSKDLSQYPIRRKVIASLIRKGYTIDQVQAAMQQLK